MYKLSRVSFFLFIFIFNYIWLRAIFIDYFFTIYENMSVIYSVLFSVIIVLVFLLIPEKIYRNDFHKNYNKSKIKYIINAFLLIELILLINYVTNILKNHFTITLSPILFIILVVVVMVFISQTIPSDIIQLSSLFGIFSLLLIGFSFIYFIDIDIKLLMPIRYKKILKLFIYSGAFIGNNMTLLLMDKNKYDGGKKNYLLSISFSLILMILELFFLNVSSGSIFLKGFDWVGFIVLSIKPVAKYVGDFNFAYIMILIISLIFKISFNYSIINKSVKNNRYFVGLFLIVVCNLVYKFLPVSELFKSIVILVLSGENMIIFWMFKEFKYARQIDKK